MFPPAILNAIIHIYKCYYLYLNFIAAFYTKIPGNCSICLSGQKILNYHICYENLAKHSKVKRQTARIEQYASKEECIKLLNKLSIFAKGFKDEGRSKEQHIKI